MAAEMAAERTAFDRGTTDLEAEPLPDNADNADGGDGLPVVAAEGTTSAGTFDLKSEAHPADNADSSGVGRPVVAADHRPHPPPRTST